MSVHASRTPAIDCTDESLLPPGFIQVWPVVRALARKYEPKIGGTRLQTAVDRVVRLAADMSGLDPAHPFAAFRVRVDGDATRGRYFMSISSITAVVDKIGPAIVEKKKRVSLVSDNSRLAALEAEVAELRKEVAGLKSSAADDLGEYLPPRGSGRPH